MASVAINDTVATALANRSNSSKKGRRDKSIGHRPGGSIDFRVRTESGARAGDSAPTAADFAAEAAAEIAALPPLPTHWLNEREIGLDEGPVTVDHLLAGTSDPTKWVLYGGDYNNHRHSPITDINPENVGNLQVAWAFPTGTTNQFEVSPTVYDGVMYVTTSFNRLFALDAGTGEIYWRYDHQLPPDPRLCCGSVNRGAAIAGDLVLMATLDAKLIAFDRKSGEIVWETVIEDYSLGFSATSMPMVVKDMAIIGIAGGEFGVRGFFDAYDIATGERRWRHYTVPDTGEPGVETWEGESYKTGGSPAWTSGAYDPEADVLYWTTGNPAPIGMVTPAKATTCIPTACWPLIRIPASGCGTSSSRRTTCGTTTATPRYSSPTSTATARPSKASCSRIATAISTSSTEPTAPSSTRSLTSKA